MGALLPRDSLKMGWAGRERQTARQTHQASPQGAPSRLSVPFSRWCA